MTYVHPFTRPIMRNTHYDTYKIDDKNIRRNEILAMIDDGYSRKEMAEALGISLSTLGTRMNRYGIRCKK